MIVAIIIGATVAFLLWPKEQQRSQPQRSTSGEWMPRSVGKVTARQWAQIDKAHRSEDQQEVLRACYLARALGFDDTAEVLSQRHADLVRKRQEQYPTPERPAEEED